MSGLSPPLQNTSSPVDREPDDWETLQKWQDERVAKKLRGEYESAVLHLSDLLQSNLQNPSRIASVRVQGALTTRDSFLAALIDPIVASASKDQSLQDVLHTSRRISHVLDSTALFHSVKTRVEASANPLSRVGDLDLVYRAREKGRFFLKTATELGNDEGNASATGHVRNVFGGAETLEANITFGTKTRRAYRAALTAPLPYLAGFSVLNPFDAVAQEAVERDPLGPTVALSIFGLERDLSTYASCTEGLRGVRGVFRTGTLLKGVHELTYEAVARHISSLTPTASISMRESAGHSIKSSLSQSWTRDTRSPGFTASDDTPFPTASLLPDPLTPNVLSTTNRNSLAGIIFPRGAYARVAHELAGLGGDAQFYKVEGEGKTMRALSRGVTLSVSTRAGVLLGTGPTGSTLFPDRFQLGGPVSVRSFRAHSMGPRDGSDAIGGDMYWAAGMSLISNIPTKPHWPVKTHAYLNAGRLDAMDRSQTLSQNVVNTLTRPSISAGLGLIYRFDPVRVEVNFGVPLVASASDGSRRGIQIGMGIEFL